MERKKSLTIVNKQATNVKTKRSVSLPYISRNAINTVSHFDNSSTRPRSDSVVRYKLNCLQANMPVFIVDNNPIRKYTGLQNPNSNSELAFMPVTSEQNANSGYFYDGQNMRGSLQKDYLPQVYPILGTERRKSCCDSISTILCSEVSSTKSSLPRSAGPRINFQSKRVFQGNRLKSWLTEQTEDKESKASSDGFPDIWAKC